MDLLGIFADGERLLAAFVDLGTFVYDILFVPLKDSIDRFSTLPFLDELLDAIPDVVWDTFLGDFTLVGLFISSGVVIYIILFLFNLLLHFIEILT